VLDVLEKMADDLNVVVRSIVVEQLSGADATALLRASAAVERRAAVLKTLVAKRAVDTNTWRAGHRSPEDWLGEELGAGFGSAKATLGASEKLGELPGLNEAARNGELSSEQLNEVADAATPENEESLLNSARNSNTNELRRKCRQEKSKSRSNADAAARAAKAHRERFFREWIDNEGAWRYEGKGTAADGARFRAAMAAETEQVFKEARKLDRRESHKAYRHDALMRLVTGTAASAEKGGRGEVIIRVDATRLAGGDGICEMSTGEVPVDEAIGAMLAGAFIKIVLHDGVDVTRVSHLGRHIPAELKTAIKERDSYRCVHCGSTHRLETHHYKTDVAKRGPTAYWNLGTLCKYCHDLVTYGGYELAGGPGRWEWIEPTKRGP
jgi:hypothetical protein